MKLLATLVAIYIAAMSSEAVEIKKPSPNLPEITVSELEKEIDKALTKCEPYFNWNDYSMKTNINQGVLLSLNYYLGEVSDKLVEVKDPKTMFRLYCCQTVVGIEDVMLGIKTRPDTVRDSALSYIKTSFTNAVTYSNSKKEKRILQNIGKRIDRLPYEGALGDMDYYVSIKKQPIGVLRKMNLAARSLIDSEYKVSLEEYKGFFRRTNSAISFIQESYKAADEQQKKMFKKESAIFKELKVELKEKYLSKS